MPLLINRKLAEDSWNLVDTESLESVEALPSGDVLLPLSFIADNQSGLENREGRIGAVVNGDDSYEQLLEVLDDLPIVAVEFPAFRDGRGFSIARKLVRQGYQGEVRAIGDVAHDRLAFMESCGFNAFYISDERFSDIDFDVFEEISVNYQGTVADPRPVFRR